MFYFFCLFVFLKYIPVHRFPKCKVLQEEQDLEQDTFKPGNDIQNLSQ